MDYRHPTLTIFILENKPFDCRTSQSLLPDERRNTAHRQNEFASKFHLTAENVRDSLREREIERFPDNVQRLRDILDGLSLQPAITGEKRTDLTQINE